MRFIRSAATTLMLAGAATLAAAAVPALTAPAFAQGPVVSVTPSAATPGESVTFTITCNHPTASAAWLSGTTLGLPQRRPMNPTTSPGECAGAVNLVTKTGSGVSYLPVNCIDGTMRASTLLGN